jgi:hypothetical protein
VACLIISTILLTMYLVIFVLPANHAVRAWWSARILSCVALAAVLLTYVYYSNCSECDIGVGSIWNGFNTLILIALIVIVFWIEVPEQPLLMVCCCCGGGGGGGAPSTGDTPPVPPTSTTSGPAIAQQQQQNNLFVTSSSPPPPLPPIIKYTRTEMVTPQGRKMVREVRMYSDGRQEVVETTIEEEVEEEEEEEKVIVVEQQQQQQPPPIYRPGHATGQLPSLYNGQSVCVTEEMRTAEGNRKTVTTTQHTDGRHEVIETVEEPSMIGDTNAPQQPPHYGDYHYPRAEPEAEGFTGSMVATEVRRTRDEMRMPQGNIQYSDGTWEV